MIGNLFILCVLKVVVIGEVLTKLLQK